jgi:predicted phosphohydrolase
VRFWAIADTHLSFGKPRDLTRFGPLWENHAERLAEDWRSKVSEEDVVLLAGDVSWATSVRHVLPDLAWLAQLPGRKVLVRGNHDRWWVDVQRVRQHILPPNFYALQGDTLTFDGVLIGGAQGHIAPNDPYYRPDPPHHRYERELATLQMVVDTVTQTRQVGQALIMLMHYPPYTSQGQATAYSQLVEQTAPALCLYGHLHRPQEWAVAVQGLKNGVDYRLISADFVGMRLQAIEVKRID